MSIINDILEKITGLDLDGSDSKETVVERPCANCPSNCAIAGTACSVCEPYKKRLIDAVYHVNHLDEYYAQFEVVSTPQISTGGTTHCTHCGANSSDPYICEYCGSQLSEAPASSGKIQVSAASEIPNPIMQAQDIIWERYDTLMKQFSTIGLKSSMVKGSLIGDLVSQLFSSDESEEETSTLGAKMSEAEIREASDLYHVSVGDYLTGLDNGKYLTLKGKKAADAQSVSSSVPASSYTPASIGLPGMAAIGMFASSMFSNSGSRHPQSSQHHPSQPVYRDVPSRPSQSQNQFRMPSGSSEHQRPSRPESRPSFPGRDSSEHPARIKPSSGTDSKRPSAFPNKPSSISSRYPSSDHPQVTPQKSTPSSSHSGGPSRERHPENRRGGSGSRGSGRG